MCGFVVIIKKSKNFSLKEIEKKNILNCQKHRGPDVCKFQEKDNLIFFHNRLKIIDLSPAGNQPMISYSGKYVIIYNGEIYNYLEIRNELEELGHQFYSIPKPSKIE